MGLRRKRSWREYQSAATMALQEYRRVRRTDKAESERLLVKAQRLIARAVEAQS